MDGTDIGNLMYLVLLGAVLVFWFFVQNRQGLGKTVKQMAAWGFIFLGTIAAVGLWSDIRTTVLPDQGFFSQQGDEILVPRARDGHYYLTLEINGAPVRFVVDTGASGVVLTQEDARKIGLQGSDLNYVNEALTANGVVRTAPVVLSDVRLGSIVDRNLRAQVNGGQMDKSLLGMTYLQRFSRLEISNGTLVLQR